MSLILKNGVLVGAANVSTIIGGVIISGIRDIDVKVSQKKENINAFQQEPVGRGRGLKEYPESTMTILIEEWKSIIAASPNRDPLQLSMFNIPIVYDNNILPSETLNNVEFTSAGRSYKSGDTALWISVNFIFAGINQ